jgi:hypothetical protein
LVLVTALLDIIDLHETKSHVFGASLILINNLQYQFLMDSDIKDTCFAITSTSTNRRLVPSDIWILHKQRNIYHKNSFVAKMKIIVVAILFVVGILSTNASQTGSLQSSSSSILSLSDVVRQLQTTNITKVTGQVMITLLSVDDVMDNTTMQT